METPWPKPGKIYRGPLPPAIETPDYRAGGNLWALDRTSLWCRRADGHGSWTTTGRTYVKGFKRDRFLMATVLREKARLSSRRIDASEGHRSKPVPIWIGSRDKEIFDSFFFLLDKFNGLR